MRLIETFGTFPDGARPRNCATVAAGAFQLAASNCPGLLWNTALTCVSIFGTVYDASPRNCVNHPYATWQYGLVGLTVEPTSPAPMPAFSSGRFARTSQLSATFCPVLVPPWTVRPLALKLTVKSKPLKYWYHFP